VRGAVVVAGAVAAGVVAGAVAVLAGAVAEPSGGVVTSAACFEPPHAATPAARASSRGTASRRPRSTRAL
jgi:hypothetical protein